MVANTGNGESENITVKPDTVASSKTSQPNGKQSTKKTKEPITREEALELLTSALSYCQQSGLSVTGYNQTTGLVLFIKGVTHSGNGIVVTPETPAVESNDKKEKVTA